MASPLKRFYKNLQEVVFQRGVRVSFGRGYPYIGVPLFAWLGRHSRGDRLEALGMRMTGNAVPSVEMIG